MKRILITSIVAVTIAITFSVSDAGWLIYHKPEFKGKVIDAETKEPIEGAVVVVLYQKYPIISGPGGGYVTVIKAKETLTDKNGIFYFPAYTSAIQPFSKEFWATFIIYKPGYSGYPSYFKITPLSDMPRNVEEIFFSESSIGREGEIREGDPEKIYKVKFGIVELIKLKTREERLRAMPSMPTDIGSNELPLLYKIMNEENKRFGLGEEK